MRKLQELLALVGLVVIWIIPVLAIRNGMPGRIPVHFDIVGNPNRWAPSSEVFLLPSVGTGLYILLTVIVLFPAAFNYPVRVTEQNRERIQSLAIEMIRWLKVELMAIFVYLDWFTIHIARQVQETNNAPGIGLGVGFTLASIGIVLVTIASYSIAMRKAK